MPLPRHIAAQVLFFSDRRCCVCREKNKAVQIHHIDGDPRNHAVENLAVLCLDCHTETQKQGGFYRRLDAPQVRLYRDEWLRAVGRQVCDPQSGLHLKHAGGITRESQEQVARLLHENGMYAALARHYDLLGESELRDRYIEIAIEHGEVPVEVEVELRVRQGRLAEVPSARLHAYITRPRHDADPCALASIHKSLGDEKEAVAVYCRNILHLLHRRELYRAAILLKRLAEQDLPERLLQEAHNVGRQESDLWMQVCTLRELGWEQELKRLLNANRERIEAGEHTLLRFELYRCTGEVDRLNATYVRLYREFVQKEKCRITAMNRKPSASEAARI
jgi:hypothetical protein